MPDDDAGHAGQIREPDADATEVAGSRAGSPVRRRRRRRWRVYLLPFQAGTDPLGPQPAVTGGFWADRGDPALFADGFESGDTGAWSATAP